MVRRGTVIYRILFIVSLLIALALVALSFSLDFTTSMAMLVISAFLFIIAFSYFSLSVRENQG